METPAAILKFNLDDASRRKLLEAFFLLACLLVPIALYSNALRLPFIFDDYFSIVSNPDIRSLGNLKTRLVFKPDLAKLAQSNQSDPARPLTYLTFALNYHFGGLDTFGYHLVNLGLHALNTLLIFLFSRRVLRLAAPSLDERDASFAALAMALFFAVHPMNAEVVNYVTHRSDSLATFFYIGAFWLFLKSDGGNRVFYALSLASFALGLSAKEIASTLPAMLLLADVLFLGGEETKPWRRRVVRHIPYWGLLAAFMAFRHFYFGRLGDLPGHTYEKWSHAGYASVQVTVVLDYLRMLVWPVMQTIDHFIEPRGALLDLRVMASGLCLAAVPAAAFWVWRKRPEYGKIAVFATAWFFVCLAPTSSFLPLNDAMAERRVYLPGWGFFAWVMILYVAVFPREGVSGAKVKLCCVLAVHIALLAAATRRRIEVFKSPEALWLESARVYPKNWRAYLSLASMEGDLDRSIFYYKKAVEADPKLIVGYLNLGASYYYAGQYDSALACYIQALQINPRVPEAYYNAGLVYLNVRKDFARARECFQSAILLKPDYCQARISLAECYGAMRDGAAAYRAYREAAEFCPEDPRVIEGLKRGKP